MLNPTSSQKMLRAECGLLGMRCATEDLVSTTERAQRSIAAFGEALRQLKWQMEWSEDPELGWAMLDY